MVAFEIFHCSSLSKLHHRKNFILHTVRPKQTLYNLPRNS